jgi:predicted DNA-binding protein with PD1-like motif
VRWRAVDNGWFVVLERGDDVHAALLRVAGEAGIESASFNGLGAADDVQLAYYDLARQEYDRRDFAGDHEIGILVGNLTRKDGEPFVHAHAVLGGRDFAAFAGHLMRARCGATLEVFIHKFSRAVERHPVPEIGLALCRL